MTASSRGHGLYRLGGACAILMALTYVIIGLTYLFLPKELKVVGTGDPAVYYPALLKDPIAALMLDWETAVMGLLGIAIVLAVSEFVRRQRDEGWVLYTGALALFGFAIKSLDSLRGGVLHHLRAEAWVHGDASTRAAIGATRLTLDYYGWFAFGAVGAWILAVSLSALRYRLLPTRLAYLGIGLAFGNELLVAGWSFGVVPLIDLGVLLTAVTGIPWFLWMGRELRRASGPPGRPRPLPREQDRAGPPGSRLPAAKLPRAFRRGAPRASMGELIPVLQRGSAE